MAKVNKLRKSQVAANAIVPDADSDMTAEDELNGDGFTDADTPTDINTDRETNINVPPQNLVIVEDPNDNAGDADATGDGSACLEDKFIEYDNPEDDGTTLEKGSQTQLTISMNSKSKSVSKKPTVLGMPIEDLVSGFVCSAQLASKLTE